MYMQFVINLCFLFWSSFLQLPSPLVKVVTCRPVPPPSFHLHALFLADHFQISRRGVFQPTSCSAVLWHLWCCPAPRPLCLGTDLWVLLPLGSPAIVPRQRPAEPRWRWVIGQVPAGWV